MKDFKEEILEIFGSTSNANLQMSFYDLQHYLVHSAVTPEIVSKAQIETTMQLFCKASLEVCEQLNKVLKGESNE